MPNGTLSTDGAEVQRQPAIAIMAIIYVAYCLLLGPIGLIALLELFSAYLKWNKLASFGCALGAVISYLALIAAYMTKKPYMSVYQDSTRLFHFFQMGVVGTIFGVSILMGYGVLPELMWVAFVFEIFVGLFYLAYIGFSFALRRPPKASAYLAIGLVAAMAVYSFQSANR